jgi:hypothetical protein
MSDQRKQLEVGFCSEIFKILEETAIQGRILDEYEFQKGLDKYKEREQLLIESFRKFNQNLNTLDDSE